MTSLMTTSPSGRAHHTAAAAGTAHPDDALSSGISIPIFRDKGRIGKLVDERLQLPRRVFQVDLPVRIRRGVAGHEPLPIRFQPGHVLKLRSEPMPPATGVA